MPSVLGMIQTHSTISRVPNGDKCEVEFALIRARATDLSRYVLLQESSHSVVLPSSKRGGGVVADRQTPPISLCLTVGLDASQCAEV